MIQLLQNRTLWLVYALAFLWGVALSWLYRFSVQMVYPFWDYRFKPGVFSFLLAALVWAFYFRQNEVKSRPGAERLFRAIVLANLLVFALLLFFYRAEEVYLYRWPLVFMFQLFWLFASLGSRLAYFKGFKLSLFAGAIPGFLLYQKTAVIWPVVALVSFLHLYPDVLRLRVSREIEKVARKKQPESRSNLLQILNFTRYFFLALSFFNAFEPASSDPYITLGILLLGFFSQQLLLRRKRAYFALKNSGHVLGYLFVLLLLCYVFLPLSYWAASGYVLLTNWATLYFQTVMKKPASREHLLAGAAIGIVILLYFLQIEWVLLVAGLFLIFVQLHLVRYFLKYRRQNVVFIFLLGLAGWVWAVNLRYSAAAEIDYLSRLVRVENEQTMFPAQWLAKLPANTVLETDILPKTVVASLKQQHFQQIIQSQYSGITFSLHLKIESILDNNRIYLFNLNRLHPYHDPGKIAYLISQIQKTLPGKVYLYVFDAYNSYLLHITAAGPEKIVLDSALLPTEAEKNLLRQLGLAMGDFYYEQSYLNKAFSAYQQVLPWFPEDSEVYRKLARVCGSLGAVELQIDYLNRFVALSKTPAIEEQKNLMEIYFWQGEKALSLEKAETLLAQDPDNAILYFRWIFKVVRSEENRFKWNALYQRVLRWPVKPGSRAEQQKQALQAEIERFLSNNPDASEIIRREQQRQEKIEFPE